MKVNLLFLQIIISINPNNAPPTCAKCAIPPPKIENPVTPENKSKRTNTGTKYLAFIG